MTSVDELFTKRLPVSLKFTERDNRQATINVSVEVHTTSTPVHKKELVVRLTDESDLFFLYTLKLSEEDFQSLKTQQGLLVDFGAFPQKFIDLLELCIQEKDKENPKFILDLVANGSNSSCTANLNVVETNAFKHLTHLSLKFLPGTDTDIKKYLAHCLKCLKDQNHTLMSRLQQTEGDLSSQLRQTREALANKTQELDALKADWSAASSDRDVTHRQQITLEREKTLQAQTEQQQRHEREKRELEQAHTTLVKQLETRLHDVESANKDLTDRRYKSESTIRELKAKLSTLEEEHHHARQELQTLRKDNAGLDCNYHEQDKLIQQLRTRVAVLEQEVKDKEEVKRKTTDLCQAEQQQKKKLEDELERKKRNIGKLEGSIKAMSEELMKANEIIKKFQGDIKTYHSKLKLRDQVNIEQEKLLGEKNREMEEVRKELEQAKSGGNQKSEEIKKLTENLQTAMQKLEESRQLLKTNENVINWLNKQVTDSQLSRGIGAAGTFEMNTSAPVPRGLHNYSGAPGYGPGSTSRLSTSVRSEASAAHGSQRPLPPRSTPLVQYQPVPMGLGMAAPVTSSAAGGSNSGVAMRGGGILAKNSPFGVIPEERSHSPQASPHHPSNLPRSRAGGSDPVIDTRFLQRTEEVPLRDATRSVTPTSTSLHFSSSAHPPITATQQINVGGANAILSQYPGNQPSIPPFQNSTRLSKDSILNQRPVIGSGPSVNKTGQMSKQSQGAPPLASAYFPSQGKVT